MSISPTASHARAAKTSAATRFNVTFAATLAGLTAAFALMLACLQRLDSLPPPPFTATTCIDEKLKFLSEQPLQRIDLIAVGSSVTWRNLDMAAFQEAGLAHHPLNAAPCYLHASETTFLTSFLLNRMPRVQTVVTVVAPRDFEACRTPSDEFFSKRLAEAYIFNGLPALPVYLANFKPQDFARDALRIRAMRTDPQHPLSLSMDAFGSGPLHRSGDWLPPPALEEACFPALTALEATVKQHGGRLVVAAFPMEAEWRRRFDPDGAIQAAFEARLQQALVESETTFLSGDHPALRDLVHADAVHLLWESARSYSRSMAERLASSNGIANSPSNGRR
ncbi:MAG: hypothetical protein ACOY4R_16685 [Pseudomonadota bacterium]